MQVLGQNKGVCRDEEVGGLDSFQIHTHARENGVNIITFRRTLISGDAGDKEFRLDSPMYTVWAMGKLDSNNEPAFHDIYPKKDVIIHFNGSEPYNDCFSFTRSEAILEEMWERSQIFDRYFNGMTQNRFFDLYNFYVVVFSLSIVQFDHSPLHWDHLEANEDTLASPDMFQMVWHGI